MIKGSTGNLTVLDAHTQTPKVYWNGLEILGIKKLRVVDSMNDDAAGDVRLRITKGLNIPEVLDAIRNAGITVKEVA